MEFRETLSESFSTLLLNKLRTGLAMLGIVIGIASVIALISLGEATSRAIQSQIQNLGSNLLTVIPGSSNTGAVRGAAGSSTSLTYEDANAIKNSTEITQVENVAPQLSRRGQATAGGNNTNTQVIGVTDSYAPVNNITIESGSFITSEDVQSMGRTAVLGPQVVTDLFPDGIDPIGQSVRIENISFRVAGVTVSKGGTGFNNSDDTIYIPLTSAQKLVYGVDYLSGISISAKSTEAMTEAQNQVGYFLLARHNLSDPAEADFSIISQSDIESAASSATGTFTALLSGIAAISLLVGGIGIMNIMLVTVTERIREIGLRKALGAKKGTIISQFLIEAILLTLAGGTIGMFLGILLSFFISSLNNLPFALSFSSIGLALAVSGGIGILFGWYPAQRAANLSPIEALRYE